MRDIKDKAWVAGVDGCTGGWIAVFVSPTGEAMPPRVLATFEDVAFAPERPATIAVDVPIGLPDHSPTKGRLAESEARSRLGDRKSSVFRIPSRRAVYASVAKDPVDDRERFFHACKIARETSDDGKAFAKQGFYILDKVVEVDTFLRTHREYITRVFETHPELAFWRFNGQNPLETPKKVKNRPHQPGLEQRRNLLVTAGFLRDFVNSDVPKGAAVDDFLDAMACAAIARRIREGAAQPFPSSSPPDSFGLPMAIWA